VTRDPIPGLASGVGQRLKVDRDVIVGTDRLEVKEMFIDDFEKSGVIPRGIKLLLPSDMISPTTSLTV